MFPWDTQRADPKCLVHVLCSPELQPGSQKLKRALGYNQHGEQFQYQHLSLHTHHARLEGQDLGRQLLTEVGFVLCRDGVIKLNIYFQEYNYRTISESAATTVRHGRGRQGWGPWGQCHIPQAAALHSGCHQCNG